MRGYSIFILASFTIFVLANAFYMYVGSFSFQRTKNMAPLEILFRGNNHFVNSADFKQARLETAESQHPLAVVVTCSDSRVSPEILFQQNIGKLFVVRTAGELVDSLEIGSIEYAVEHLHVPLVIVLGHENCGAVKAWQEDGEADGSIKKIVDMIDAEAEIQNLELMNNAGLHEYIMANIRHSTNSIYQSSKVIQEKHRKKEVQLVSAIYNLESGKVKFFK